ncbi:hypothetical protein C3F09_06870 [candidate division GN15 bacterium]|uniref:Pentapeptide repeat-containing protein n=1 Tax=candidate division GN15 bacterium TaxID=2072418 RepID=A0A855X5V0_9BACT|nr:MAG: hypothetical protein C3F09_06870 [candidate division GN15 bacterium]
MAACVFPLANGTLCGLTTRGDGVSCDFHARKDRGHALSYVANYLKQCWSEGRGTAIDLSSTDFVRLSFNSIELPLFDAQSHLPIELDFSNSKFQDCRFDRIHLKNTVFSNCEFQNTRFLQCRFLGKKCDFTSVECQGSDALFEKCIFQLGTKGLDVVKADFSNSYFSVGRSLFNRCAMTTTDFRFAGCTVIADRLEFVLMNDIGNDLEASAVDLTINRANRICLSGLAFSGRFALDNRHDHMAFAPELDLTAIDFSRMASSRMRHTNLTKARFLRSFVEPIRFDNATWPCQHSFVSRRKTHWLSHDEEYGFPRHASHWVELRQLYVQLKKNYESRCDYIDAGHWFFREMQCRREAMLADIRWKPWRLLRRYMLSLAALYKYVSDYGESQKRPLVWLIGTMMLFAICYNVTGTSGFWNSLGVSFSTMMFQLGRNPKELPPQQYTIALIQTLLTAILVPLYLLALRRKFRR